MENIKDALLAEQADLKSQIDAFEKTLVHQELTDDEFAKLKELNEKYTAIVAQLEAPVLTEDNDEAPIQTVATDPAISPVDADTNVDKVITPSTDTVKAA
jgi:hypothetical protein